MRCTTFKNKVRHQKIYFTLSNANAMPIHVETKIQRMKTARVVTKPEF